MKGCLPRRRAKGSCLLRVRRQLGCSQSRDDRQPTDPNDVKGDCSFQPLNHYLYDSFDRSTTNVVYLLLSAVAVGPCCAAACAHVLLTWPSERQCSGSLATATARDALPSRCGPAAFFSIFLVGEQFVVRGFVFACLCRWCLALLGTGCAAPRPPTHCSLAESGALQAARLSARRSGDRAALRWRHGQQHHTSREREQRSGW